MSGQVRQLGPPNRWPMGRLEEGFTLTELLVVVTISSIIMAALASAFIVGARTEADAYTRLQESHDGQLATAYFVADASSASYYSSTLIPPGSNCPDFGTNDVALFEWLDSATSPPTKKDAFYGVNGSPGQLIRRYCEGDALQYEVSLAKNLSTDPTLGPIVTCPLPALSCANLPAALQLQVWETSGYTYTLRASPRSMAVVYPVGRLQALIGSAGIDLTHSVLTTSGYIIVSAPVAGASCTGSSMITALDFEVNGPNAGCGTTTPWTNQSDHFSSRTPPPQPPDAAVPVSSIACGGPAQTTYQPGHYAASATLGPGCLATGTYFLSGTTTLSHVTSAAAGVLIYVAAGDLLLDGVKLGPLASDPGPYKLTIFMNTVDNGTIRAKGATDTVQGAIYALSGTLSLKNETFHSDYGTELNALIAVNSIVN